MKINWLSKKHKMLKPDLERTNAGVLPAIIKHLNGVDELKQKLQGREINPDLDERLSRYFPNGIDNVVFLICDGVGVRHLEKLGGLLWDNINPAEDTPGTVAHCTFPTLTSTNMASIAFGMLPKDHGMVGYNIYNETLGTIFNALNGEYIKDGEKKSIHEYPNDRFVKGTPITDFIYGKDYIPMKFFVPSQQGREGLITLIAEKTVITPYDTPEQLLGGVISSLSEGKPQQFIAAYIGYADYFGHEEGPDSKEYTEAIRGIEQIIQTIIEHPKVKQGNTLVLMTSDHGQSQIDHSISRWLTRDEVKQLEDQGIRLGTSGRALHCYTSDIEAAKKYLEETSEGRGIVISKEEALGLIGDTEGTWSERMGDLVFIMDDHYLLDVPEVVKLEGHKDKLLGQHGGLSVDETFIPIGVWGGNLD